MRAPLPHRLVRSAPVGWDTTTFIKSLLSTVVGWGSAYLLLAGLSNFARFPALDGPAGELLDFECEGGVGFEAKLVACCDDGDVQAGGQIWQVELPDVG